MAIDEPKAGEADCECIYLHAFETGSEARAGIGRWIDDDVVDRPHETHGGRTPVEVDEEAGDIGPAAAFGRVGEGMRRFTLEQSAARRYLVNREETMAAERGLAFLLGRPEVNVSVGRPATTRVASAGSPSPCSERWRSAAPHTLPMKS